MVAGVSEVAGLCILRQRVGVAMDLLIFVDRVHRYLPFQVIGWWQVDVRECRLKNGVCLGVRESHCGAFNRLEGFELDSPGAFIASS